MQYLTLCVECVNGNHGFGSEEIRKHSCEAHGICDDCREQKQVATYRSWLEPRYE